MAKIKKLNIAQNNPKRALRVALGLALSSFFVYFYVVGSITFNVIERKNIENEIKNLNSELSQVELEYLTLDRQINLDLAHQLGFQENPNTFFAYRKVLVAKK